MGTIFIMRKMGTPFSIKYLLISTIILLNLFHPSLCDDDSELRPLKLNTEDEYNEFMSRTDKIPIALRYPTMVLFSTSVIGDYFRVAKLLANNEKCVFGIYETPVELTGDISELEPHLICTKNNKELVYEGVLNTGYMMGWITHEDLCELRIADQDRLLLYRRTCLNGHMQIYAMFTEDTFTEQRLKNVYEVLRETDYRVSCIYIKEKALTDHLLDRINYELVITKFPTILILRQIPYMREYRFFYKSMDEREDLREFFLTHLMPIINGTNSYLMPKLFKMNKTIVYIYTKSDELAEYLSERWIENKAPKYLDKLMFLHSKGSKIVEKRLNTLLYIDQDYVETAVRALDIVEDTLELRKYRPTSLEDGEITVEGLEQFLDDLREGRLRHYIKSELAIPENVDTGAVKTIVGEDFHKRVIEAENDVLIVFYSPWCGHCHISKRIFRDVGRRLKDVNSITIATFDAYNNEVEDIEINAYPTIAMFPYGAKDKPVFFTHEVNLQNIAQFIQDEARKEFISAESLLMRNIEHEPIFELHTEL